MITEKGFDDDDDGLGGCVEGSIMRKSGERGGSGVLRIE